MMEINLDANQQYFDVMLGALLLLLGIFSFVARTEETGEKIFPIYMAAGITFLGLFLAFGLGYLKPQWDKKSPYKTVVQGVYERTEYNHTGGLISHPQTVIYFTDSQTYVLKGSHNIPFKKGEKIEISENKGWVKITKP